jgi:Protein of unknown function (DUF3175)
MTGFGKMGDGPYNARPCAIYRLASIAGGTRLCAQSFPVKDEESRMPAQHTWSQNVTEHSDALDLDPHIFESDDPRHIAESLKRSAEHSKRRKGTSYQSAMSMLTFYINRAGHNLPAKRKAVLEAAKDELRKDFGREA